MNPPSVFTLMICKLVEDGFEGSKETIRMPPLCRATYSIQGSVLGLDDNGKACLDTTSRLKRIMKIGDANLLTVMQGTASWI
jgi:hypothetical protein